jgi:hypothetical protein
MLWYPGNTIAQAYFDFAVVIGKDMVGAERKKTVFVRCL